MNHAVLGTPIHPPFPDGFEHAVFGMGCFWGAERVFWQASGVYTTAVGYSGGTTPDPSYEQVCSGTTGHAEAVEVTFDPSEVSYGELVDRFWSLHDPTQVNRQGWDVGTQYRSAIFFTTPAQKTGAQAYIDQLAAARKFPRAIVTQVVPLAGFHRAEDYHQEYWEGEGQRNPYCLAVIPPKLMKLRKSFQDKVKAG